MQNSSGGIWHKVLHNRYRPFGTGLSNPKTTEHIVSDSGMTIKGGIQWRISAENVWYLTTSPGVTFGPSSVCQVYFTSIFC